MWKDGVHTAFMFREKQQFVRYVLKYDVIVFYKVLTPLVVAVVRKQGKRDWEEVLLI